jgi:hypothetical protein
MINLVTSPLFRTLVNVSFYVLGSAVSTVVVNNQWERSLVDKGYAEYNNKTKEWYLCSADQIVLNTNDKSVIGDVPFGISTASSYIKYLLNEVKDQKQQVDVLEKQLFEKESLLEKHRKVSKN